MTEIFAENFCRKYIFVEVISDPRLYRLFHTLACWDVKMKLLFQWIEAESQHVYSIT